AALLDHSDLRIDGRTRCCTVDEHAAHVTPRESDLLARLARRPGTVLRRERSVADLWGWDDGLGRGSLDTHVKSLRSKVGHGRIRTVHGVGYALEDGDGR